MRLGPGDDSRVATTEYQAVSIEKTMHSSTAANTDENVGGKNAANTLA
jgi:hypothetical protein